MWTRTDDCFCHEQVRQSRSPNSAAPQRRISSAGMASKSRPNRSLAEVASTASSGRGRLAKEHLLERVAAQPEPERLERDHLFGWNVSQIDNRPELLDEPRLRGLRRRLPDQVVERHGRGDLVDEVGPHLAARSEDASAAALAG